MLTRRNFIKTGTAGTLGLIYGGKAAVANESSKDIKVQILNPANRNPVSLIIDDSTSLVNLAHFGIPQFREIFPDQYPQDWRKLPHEIPDDFIREFGNWCGENGVKGKFSMVPYPACTGWLNRFIPGWSTKELQESLKLVREFMQPDWDIHPEMISHTRVINIKTGVPYPDATPQFMENWEWSQDKSADELGNYIAYALNILKDAGFSCEGMTTPGGFGGRNMDNLALGTQQAMKDVFGVDISHFFRDVITDPDKSVEPQMYHVKDIDSGHAQVAVHIIGCTNDWFGGWDGLNPGSADFMITPDLQKGRLLEVIGKAEPAIMVCHWPGIYFNGEKHGFNVLKNVVSRLHEKYDHLLWMKQRDIAHYWAAKKLTRISADHKIVKLNAPFESELFTISISGKFKLLSFQHNGEVKKLRPVSDPLSLRKDSCYRGKKETLACFNLPKGISTIELQ